MLIFQSLFIISPLIGLLLLFWYKTDFVLVYGKLFGLKKILKIDLYEEKKKFDIDLKYYVFLAKNYRNFFIKMLTCEICFSTWLSGIICIIYSLLTKDLNLIFLIPFNILLGLYLYSTIKKII